MSLKDALTNCLLMFVAATCVVLIVKALPPTPPTPQALAGIGGENGSTAAPKNSPAPALAVQDGINVYYFHGNTRCPTCRTIEAYAQEAVEAGFADELQSGKINWQVINYESPGNERYATDYGIAAPAVVLARFKDGKQVSWKALPEVWEHVGNKPVFLAFVQDSLRMFIQGGEPKDAGSPPLPKAADTPPLPKDSGTPPVTKDSGPLPLPQ